MRSLTAATTLTSVGVVIAWFVLNAVLQTSSRITWSLARDNALTFSKHLVKVHPKLEVPIYSLLLNYAILVICGCIFLASRTGKCPSGLILSLLLSLLSLEADKNGNNSIQCYPELLRGAATNLFCHACSIAPLPPSLVHISTRETSIPASAHCWLGGQYHCGSLRLHIHHRLLHPTVPASHAELYE